MHKNVYRDQPSYKNRRFNHNQSGFSFKIEVESRTQDSRPRPQKIRGREQRQEPTFRGQTLSRPRTEMLEAKVKDQGHNALVLSKKSNKQQRFSREKSQIFCKILDVLLKKKIFINFPRGIWRALRRKKKGHDLGPYITNQKIVLPSAKDRAFSRTCRLRGLGQKLEFQCQRQGLLNVFTRTSSRPKKSSSTPALL